MEAEQHLRFGPYQLDLATMQLWRGSQAVKLPPKALAVLCLLVSRAGQVVTKDVLFQAVWADTVVGDDALTSCIQELRQVLHDDARKPRYIETAHRRGYRFIGKAVSGPSSVVRQTEEVASSQHSVGSREEANQKANGENGLESNGQGLDSVMPAQPVPSLYWGAGIQKAQAPASPDPPWIPASAGMTPSPATPQNRASSPQPDQTLDPQRQTRDGSVLTHFWPSRRFVWLAVVLLLGVSTTVRYRASFHNPQSVIHNQEALPLPDKPSIAVMPFTNMSGDPAQEYFSDGLTDDLITALSRLSQLFVIARHSVFIYKGKAVKVQEVSKELGVQYLLEGSVQKTDQQVRINAQLVDAATGRHLWAERYDRPFRDIFALQDEIVQKTVFALKVKLTQEEQERFQRFPTDNLEAYDYVLRGLEPYLRFTKEANIQARQLFERAIALDPKYAGAYAWLGWTYVMEWFFHSNQDLQHDLERAFELAQRARALDDAVPDVHQLLAWVYLQRNQPEQALTEAERALTLDPNYADSYHTLAHVLNFVGRPQEAIGVAEKAVRLDPRGPMVASYLLELGFAYLLTGRVEEAIATDKQALVHDPNSQFAYTNLAFSYVFAWGWQLGQDPQVLERAFEAAQKALALNNSLPWAHCALGQVYLLQKRHDQARAEAERAIALDPNLADGDALLAMILSFTGKPQEAIAMAEKAVRLNPSFLFELGHAYYSAGRYEEAIAALKQLLSRNPNALHAQFILALAASEVGREEEAQAAVAEVLRISPNFSLEVHKQRMPIKDPAILERHITALRKAGLK